MKSVTNFLIIKWKIYSQPVKGFEQCGRNRGHDPPEPLTQEWPDPTWNGLCVDIGADWKMVVSSWAEIVGIVTAWFCTHLVQPFAPFFPLWKVHWWLMTYTLACLARTIVWTGGFIFLEEVFGSTNIVGEPCCKNSHFVVWTQLMWRSVLLMNAFSLKIGDQERITCWPNPLMLNFVLNDAELIQSLLRQIDQEDEEAMGTP